MASIQDVANAAYRIGDSASSLSQQSAVCSDTINQHSARLLAVVRGSTSGEQAVRQIGTASAAIRESSVRMASLYTTVQAFISDLTK